MDKQDFRTKISREEQADRARREQNQAAREMRMRTMMQGLKVADDYIKTKVDAFTPEYMRRIALMICPKWYTQLWFGSLSVVLMITKFIWIAVSWILLFAVQQRMARVLYRGGHIARIGNGPSEFVVRIKFYRWWRHVYQCDFDVRNGRVTEVFEPKEKKEEHKNGRP